jgi:hypothetical protein
MVVFLEILQLDRDAEVTVAKINAAMETGLHANLYNPMIGFKINFS